MIKTKMTSQVIRPRRPLLSRPHYYHLVRPWQSEEVFFFLVGYVRSGNDYIDRQRARCEDQPQKTKIHDLQPEHDLIRHAEVQCCYRLV